MKITIYCETFPYNYQEYKNPEPDKPHSKEAYIKLTQDFLINYNLNIDYLEGNMSDFPAEGFVLYHPYYAPASIDLLRKIKSPERVILLDVTYSDLKRVGSAVDIGGAVMLGAFEDEIYPDKIFIVGKKGALKEYASGSVPWCSDLFDLNPTLFKALPQALAWYIKELYKSGLVKT
jgi:hypothetical protein